MCVRTATLFFNKVTVFRNLGDKTHQGHGVYGSLEHLYCHRNIGTEKMSLQCQNIRLSHFVDICFLQCNVYIALTELKINNT